MGRTNATVAGYMNERKKMLVHGLGGPWFWWASPATACA